MRKNIFIDANIGNAIKKFGIYFAVFVISFGFVSSLRNAGGTYAINAGACESSGGVIVYDENDNNKMYCCPETNNHVDWEPVKKMCKTDTTTNNTCPNGYSSNANSCYANVLDITISLTLNPNGGKFTLSNVEYNQTKVVERDRGQTFKLPTPTRNGKVFSHWSYVGSESMGTPISYNGGDNLTVTEDAVLTAVWEDDTTAPTEYSVTLNPNGGVWADGTQTNHVVSYTGSKSLSDAAFVVTKPSFELCGWMRSSDNKILTNEIDEEENGLTLTAQWCADDEGDNNEGDNTGGDNTPDDGGNTGGETPEVPEKTEYTIKFYGNGGTIYKDGAELTTTIFNYSVDNPTRISFSDYIVEREGKEFIGWCVDDANCENPSLDGFVETIEDTILYAQFKDAVNTNKNVMFNSIGGTLYKNGRKTTTNAYQLTSLNYADYKAEKEGYKFIGWRSTGQSCEDASLNKKVSTISNKLNLYACYEIDSDIDKNPNTGSWLLYIAYLVGILALVYTVYYSYRVVKTKN